MIQFMNMLGTILNATNGLVLAGMVGYILAKDGIAYRKWLWCAFVYPLLQGITASSVFLNIYSARFPVVMSCCRLALGLAGQILTVIVAIYLREFISFLRESFDTEERLREERNEALWGAENIVTISRHANEKQDGHLAVLKKQVSQSASHA